MSGPLSNLLSTITWPVTAAYDWYANPTTASAASTASASATATASTGGEVDQKEIEANRDRLVLKAIEGGHVDLLKHLLPSKTIKDEGIKAAAKAIESNDISTVRSLLSIDGFIPQEDLCLVIKAFPESYSSVNLFQLITMINELLPYVSINDPIKLFSAMDQLFEAEERINFAALAGHLGMVQILSDKGTQNIKPRSESDSPTVKFLVAYVRAGHPIPAHDKQHRLPERFVKPLIYFGQDRRIIDTNDLMVESALVIRDYVFRQDFFAWPFLTNYLITIHPFIPETVTIVHEYARGVQDLTSEERIAFHKKCIDAEAARAAWHHVHINTTFNKK